MASQIQTARLVLRPLRKNDAPALAKAMDDLDVTRWLTSPPHPYGLRDAVDFIDRNTASFPDVAAIETQGQFAGVIGVKRELGCWLGRAFWGRGIAFEAAQAMVRRVFTTAGRDVLLAGHFDGNDRSARVLRKLGFEYTGQDRVTPPATGIETVCHKMRLTRAAWAAQ